MYPHHQRAIDRIREKFADDPEFLAILLTGSLSRARARENSDVDIYMIVDDETFSHLQRENRLFYFNRELCDYPGGYIDGKIVPYSFLLEAASHGSEPTRSSFLGAYPIYNRITGLEEDLAKIPVYPTDEKQVKINAFYSQVQLLGKYFMNEALRKDNQYLLLHTVADLVLFGGRLVLAHNEALFPGHKGLFAELDLVRHKPEGFMVLSNMLMKDPTAENTKAFVDCIECFFNEGISYQESVSIFVENNEWNWRQGRPPLADW